MTLSTLSNLSLSELIKTARKTNNLTQTAFGKFFEPSIAQPTIARWEKGDLFPDRKHFPKIASLLNLTLEELLNIVHEQLEEHENACRKLEEETYICDNRHLRVLNKGSKAWNRWRNKNDRILPELEGSEPKEDYFDEIDLHGAYLRKSNFQGKSLKRADLRGADLREANLSNADLSSADLRFANLTKSNLKKTNLSNANLSGANLSEAIFIDAVLCDANLKQANLSNADLTHADIREANLNQANLEYAILKYCFVYGISDWNINLHKAVQKKLSICPHKTNSMYVDCIENAHLKLLEIDNREIPEIHQSAINLQTAINKNRVSFKEKLKNFKIQKDLKIKSKIDRIPGEKNIENTSSCKILRCIYYFQASLHGTYCLIRIYEFKSKTIVLASQLFGTILWDSFLIKDVIDDLNLNQENLYWINHYGLFSDIGIEEKFLHTTFSYKKDSIFSSKEVDLEQEMEVNIKFIEDLIESSLESVELWLGLDLVAESEFIRAREERTFELLYHYLKDNIEHLYKQREIIKILSQSRPGAIFFYPNQRKNFDFIDYGELSNCNDNSRKKALAYIDKSFPDEEVVICICIGNHDPFCTILRKDFFVNPARINFLSVEKLVVCEMQSLESDMVKFDVDQYREKIESGKKRLESLLQLYLEPKFEYFKSLKPMFEQMESAQSKLEAQRGALFYYPEHNQCLFSLKQQLTDKFEMLAIPYVDSYDVETEVVICFSIFNKLSVCGIFPKF